MDESLVGVYERIKALYVTKREEIDFCTQQIETIKEKMNELNNMCVIHSSESSSTSSVFAARTVKNSDYEQVNLLKEELERNKRTYDEMCIKLEMQRSDLKDLELIMSTWNEKEKENQKQLSTANEVSSDLIGNLEVISKRLEVTSKIICQDPNRARIEIDEIQKMISRYLLRLKNS